MAASQKNNGQPRKWPAVAAAADSPAYFRLAPPVAFLTDSPTLVMAAVDAFEICSKA
jgi:hypothetical protein